MATPNSPEWWDARFSRRGGWEIGGHREQTTTFMEDLWAHLPAEWLHRLRVATSVVDVGCAFGDGVDVLRHEGCAGAWGVDRSPVAVERARRLYPGVRFEARDSIGEAVDVAISSNVLEHTPDSEAFAAGILEYAPALILLAPWQEQPPLCEDHLRSIGPDDLPPTLAGADRVAIGWLSSPVWAGGLQVWAIYERRS